MNIQIIVSIVFLVLLVLFVGALVVIILIRRRRSQAQRNQSDQDDYVIPTIPTAEPGLDEEATPAPQQRSHRSWVIAGAAVAAVVILMLGCCLGGLMVNYVLSSEAASSHAPTYNDSPVAVPTTESVTTDAGVATPLPLGEPSGEPLFDGFPPAPVAPTGNDSALADGIYKFGDPLPKGEINFSVFSSFSGEITLRQLAILGNQIALYLDVAVDEVSREPWLFGDFRDVIVFVNGRQYQAVYGYNGFPAVLTQDKVGQTLSGYVLFQGQIPQASQYKVQLYIPSRGVNVEGQLK